jgi:hypothetical protein
VLPLQQQLRRQLVVPQAGAAASSAVRQARLVQAVLRAKQRQPRPALQLQAPAAAVGVRAWLCQHAAWKVQAALLPRHMHAAASSPASLAQHAQAAAAVALLLLLVCPRALCPPAQQQSLRRHLAHVPALPAVAAPCCCAQQQCPEMAAARPASLTGRRSLWAAPQPAPALEWVAVPPPLVPAPPRPLPRTGQRPPSCRRRSMQSVTSCWV